MFDHVLLVECKNWTAPAEDPELAVFNDKLTSRGRPMASSRAAAGITGNLAALTAAHEVLARALSQGRAIVVLTRREIEELADTADLVLLLKRKRAQLAVSGTIFEQAGGWPLLSRGVGVSPTRPGRRKRRVPGLRRRAPHPRRLWGSKTVQGG